MAEGNGKLPDRPALGSGNVKVIIDGEHRELVPSYAAMVAISARGGGLRGAIERVLNLDAETIVAVVTVGLGYGGDRRPPADLAERIWRTGFMLHSGGLADACFRYVNALANGGRPLAEDSEDGKVGEARQDSADPPRPAGA